MRNGIQCHGGNQGNALDRKLCKMKNPKHSLNSLIAAVCIHIVSHLIRSSLGSLLQGQLLVLHLLLS